MLPNPRTDAQECKEIDKCGNIENILPNLIRIYAVYMKSEELITIVLKKLVIIN